MEVDEEVMIDIETASTQPNAAILTIGAIKFNRQDQLLPLSKLKTFYRRIDLNSCENLNLRISKDTMDWWDQQNEEARYEAFTHPDRIQLGQALREFVDWFGDPKIVWANSPAFDCVILINAFKLCKLKAPWNFWQERDCRTFYDIKKVSMSTIPKADHNALSDCYRQLTGLKMVL